jgi:hypothetical protein
MNIRTHRATHETSFEAASDPVLTDLDFCDSVPDGDADAFDDDYELDNGLDDMEVLRSFDLPED